MVCLWCTLHLQTESSGLIPIPSGILLNLSKTRAKSLAKYWYFARPDNLYFRKNLRRTSIAATSPPQKMPMIKISCSFVNFMEQRVFSKCVFRKPEEVTRKKQFSGNKISLKQTSFIDLSFQFKQNVLYFIIIRQQLFKIFQLTVNTL